VDNTTTVGEGNGSWVVDGVDSEQGPGGTVVVAGGTAAVVVVVVAVVVEGPWAVSLEAAIGTASTAGVAGGAGTAVVLKGIEVDEVGAESARVVVEEAERSRVDEGVDPPSPDSDPSEPSAAKSSVPGCSAAASAVTSLPPARLTANPAKNTIATKVTTQIPIESRPFELGSLCINRRPPENCLGRRYPPTALVGIRPG